MKFIFQVLVASKRKKTLTYAIGGVAMVAVIAVVVTLVVVLSGNEGGTAEPIVSTTQVEFFETCRHQSFIKSFAELGF